MNHPDPVTRLNAALEGRYRIERQLGEGGMATVYLADDLRHERKVALKVLKPELAAVVGADRFLAEIKTTANLQHPHILPLHDSGEADSFLYYVMPYVEGDTLRDRLDRDHQLPVDEAARIATNVAEALDYAHSHGVIHRDIKPANILLHAGKPVISDFGIALAVGAAGGGRLTETGLSLGTPHYMSPEQATGDAHVGPATDIYALGCVLYEMLVGDPPFMGSTPQAVLGKIITGEFDPVTKYRKTVPANIEATIRRALEKVPADRFIGAQKFAKALSDPGFRHGDGAVAGVAGSVGPWKRMTVGFSSLAALMTLAFGWALLRPEPPSAIQRFEVISGEPLPIGRTSVDLSLSPDGSRIVYAALPPTGDRQLWQRALDDLVPVPIPGTEGAQDPVFSPDGLAVAFSAQGNYKTVSLSGGPPFTVVASNVGTLSPAWGWDGMIYFDRRRVIHRVPATGGDPVAVTLLTEGALHGLPEPLPDGRGLLLTVVRGTLEESRIAVVGPEGGEVREILTGVMARYAASGHVVYATADGTLMAAPFDLKRLEVTGPPVAMLEGIDMQQSAAKFAMSPSGSLLYGTGTERAQQVVLVDALGMEEVLPIEVGPMSSPRFSPDGRFISYVGWLVIR